MPAVVVVDDHASFRAAARAVVEATDGFDWVGEAATGEDAVRLVTSLRPGLVLMDVDLPGIDGLEATRRILASEPGVMVVVCSSDLPAGVPSVGAAASIQKGDLSPEALRRVWGDVGLT